MNELNSVLIDGTLTGDPYTEVTPEGPRCHFRIESVYRFKDSKTDVLRERYYHFDIVARDRQAKVCQEHLKTGRGVRVVGRLSEGREYCEIPIGCRLIHSVYIAAEHVTIKPVTE